MTPNLKCFNRFEKTYQADCNLIGGYHLKFHCHRLNSSDEQSQRRSNQSIVFRACNQQKFATNLWGIFLADFWRVDFNPIIRWSVRPNPSVLQLPVNFWNRKHIWGHVRTVHLLRILCEDPRSRDQSWLTAIMIICNPESHLLHVTCHRAQRRLQDRDRFLRSNRFAVHQDWCSIYATLISCCNLRGAVYTIVERFLFD